MEESQIPAEGLEYVLLTGIGDQNAGRSGDFVCQLGRSLTGHWATSISTGQAADDAIHACRCNVKSYAAGRAKAFDREKNRSINFS